jgi:hypothetical protein
MKSLILAAVVAASLSTSAFALDTLSEVDKDKLIDQCAAKHTLDPNLLTGLPEDEVIAKLQDCANGPDATPVAASTTAQRFAAAQSEAGSVSPAPRRSSGGFSTASASSDDDTGASDGASDANAGGGGLGGLFGHHHHGDQDDGGGGTATDTTNGTTPAATTATTGPAAGTGAGTTGTAGTAAGTGANPAPKLSTVQKDAVLGSGLKAGEGKESISAKNIGNGLKQVTVAQVTKNADGTVTVKRQVTTVNAQGAQVGTPKTTNQKFTPADINVLKSANGTNPIGNAPTFAPQNGVNAAQNLHSAQHLSLRDRINQKMAAAGKPGANTKTSALDRFKQKLQAKSTNPTLAKSSALDRFKQRQAAKANTASHFRQIHAQKTKIAQHVKTRAANKVAAVSHHTAVRHAVAHRLANKKVHLARR